MSYPFYLIVLGLLPSVIWLLFFLKRDMHPESPKMILKIFFYGMLAALPAALIEMQYQRLPFGNLVFAHEWQSALFLFLNIAIGVAFVEEFLKYLVVRGKVLRHKELDEPMDLLLYMIIAALGFAALENIFIFLSPESLFYTLGDTLALASFRFVSATFLHALVSGTLGFFMALSYYKTKRRKLFLTTGFSVAVLLHGLYNFSIMELEGILKFGIPIIILSGLAIFIYFGIKYLRKLKGICKID
ncbi:PrsW family intramembrane metalloprotease [Patescibacteria group bacterium]